MTNSTWTYNHIMRICNSNKIVKVYPPCDITCFVNAQQMRTERTNHWRLISIGQFRPEKDHMQQIEIMKILLDNKANVKLTVIGATRNKEDKKILRDLQDKVAFYKLGERVTFKENISRNDIVKYLAESDLGIHTMKFEHFGISIVEMMASGCPVVAHNSAGAKNDIILGETTYGFLAESTGDYVDAITSCIRDESWFKTLQGSAIKRAQQFSSEAFKQAFINIFDKKNK